MKCVLVIDRSLPLGLIANTAAVLALSLSRKAENLIGNDIVDGSGLTHLGITRLPVPALAGDRDTLVALRNRLSEPSFGNIHVVGFTSLAQGCKTYEEYSAKLGAATASDLHYLGLGLYGAKAKINQLTGSLPLLK